MKNQLEAWLVASAIILVIASGCGLQTSSSSGTNRSYLQPTNAWRNSPSWHRSLVPAASEPATAGTTTAVAAYSLDLYGLYLTPPSWTDTTGSRVDPGFEGFAIGDMTRDGRNDVVGFLFGAQTSNGEVGEDLMVFPQLNSGELGQPLHYPLASTHVLVNGMVLVDMNEDGVLDVVLTRYQEHQVLLSTPGGRIWKTLPGTQLSFDLPSVALDVDRDGHIDLVSHVAKGFTQISTDGVGRLLISYGDGTGGIREQKEIRTFGSDPNDSETPDSMVVGDFNGDRLLDLAERVRTCSYWQQTCRSPLRIFLHDGGTGFLAPSEVSNSEPLKYLVAGDFNGDGRQDLAVANDTVTDYRIYFFYQTAAGRLSLSATSKATYEIPVYPSVADLDRNGSDDLIVPHSGWNTLGYYLQHGHILDEEVLRSVADRAPGFGPNTVAVGDINGDGCPDAVSTSDQWQFAVLHGSGCVFTGPMRSGGQCPAYAVN